MSPSQAICEVPWIASVRGANPSTLASWLNQVERLFAALTVKQIRRGSFRSPHQLEAAIGRYLDHHNAWPKPFRWTKSADDILNALGGMTELRVKCAWDAVYRRV